jgi:Transglutaminase-like superfamily
MRDLIDEGKCEPSIVHAARSMVWLLPPMDEYAEARTIYEFVRDRVRYVKDVHGVETLARASHTLKSLTGDCDDQSVLLGSLLESIGHPVRLVVSGYSAPGVFEHVHLQVYVSSQWIDADPTEPMHFGWQPENPVVQFVESLTWHL